MDACQELEHVRAEVVRLTQLIERLNVDIAKREGLIESFKQREQELMEALGMTGKQEKEPANPDHPLRVYEVAKKHGIAPKEVLAQLATVGVDTSHMNHLSIVDRKDVKRAFETKEAE